MELMLTLRMLRMLRFAVVTKSPHQIRSQVWRTRSTICAISTRHSVLLWVKMWKLARFGFALSHLRRTMWTISHSRSEIQTSKHRADWTAPCASAYIVTSWIINYTPLRERKPPPRPKSRKLPFYRLLVWPWNMLPGDGAMGQNTYDFLLVFYSNFGRISYLFFAAVDFMPKWPCWATVTSKRQRRPIRITSKMKSPWDRAKTYLW